MQQVKLIILGSKYSSCETVNKLETKQKARKKGVFFILIFDKQFNRREGKHKDPFYLDFLCKFKIVLFFDCFILIHLAIMPHLFILFYWEKEKNR